MFAGRVPLDDDVRALVILVRFPDDNSAAPGWPIVGTPDPRREELPGFADVLIDVSDDPGSYRPNTLSDFFYRQSTTGSAGPHLLYGDVAPFVYVPENSNAYYLSNQQNPEDRKGYGFLTREVLDYLTSAGGGQLDLGLYDHNEDFVVDQIIILVRDDVTQCNYCGVADLAGAGDTRGFPLGQQTGLEYASDVLGTVEVRWAESGQYNWQNGEGIRLITHEYGHHVFQRYWGGHQPPIENNSVPRFGGPPPYTRGSYDYIRMAGPTFEGGEYAFGSAALSAQESVLRQWTAANELSGSAPGLSATDFWTTRGLHAISLGGDAPTARVFITNRQPDLEPGLAEETRGLVVEFACGGRLDILAADNTLWRTPPGYPYVWQDDAFDPDVFPQLTPWTRPGINGWTEYPAIEYCDEPANAGTAACLPEGATSRFIVGCPFYGSYQCQMDTGANLSNCPSLPSGLPGYPRAFEPSWQAIDNVRYHANGQTILFDFYADYRDPGAGNSTVIRSDSWMGAETSGSTFARPVIVTNGATLTIWQEPTIDFAAGLTVEPGARLVIEAGPTLRFGPGQYLTVDGEIDVQGSSSAPVIFTRQNAGAAWGGLLIRDDSQIDFARVYGAFVGIETSAPILVINNAHIAANDTGILTDYDLSGEELVRSFLYLENSCVAENTAEGITARNANIAIVGSAVEDNGDGLSILNAEVAPVYDSRIAGNGIGATTGATGELVLFDPGEVVHGHNRVLGNTGLELAAGEGSTLIVGVEGVGHNRVSDGSGALIRNEAGGSLPARETWWGSASGPPAGAFIGSVDAKNYLSSDASEAGPACPALSFSEGGSYAVTSSPTARVGAGAPTASVTTEPADPEVYYAALRREIVAARAAAQQAVGRPESMHPDSAAAAVWRLAALQGLDARDTLGEASATEAAISSLRELLGQGGMHATTRAASEIALLAAVDGRLAVSDAVGAQALVDWGATRSERPVTLRGLTLRRAILDERAGRRTEAAAVYTAEADRLEAAGSPELAALYRRQAAHSLRRVVEPEAGATAAVTTVTPAVLALGPARPNPATGRTVLPLSLPTGSDVQAEAYDALGRRVAVLHSGRLEAGMHDLALDAAGLAPGVYVVRVVVDNAPRLTRRLTVAR